MSNLDLGAHQQTAFDHVKSLLTSDTVLAHYNQAKTLVTTPPQLICSRNPNW